MRDSAYALDGTAKYREDDNGEQTVTLTFAEYSVKFYIDSTKFEFYMPTGEKFLDCTLDEDQKPQFVGGKCYLPARALGRAVDIRRWSITYITDAESGCGDYVLYVNKFPTKAEALALVRAGAEQIDNM